MPSGEWRLIESWARPVFSEDGKFLGHVGTSLDITDRREAEDERERLLNRLAKERQLVHELSAPILRVATRILLLPLVGVVDDERAGYVTQALLDRVRNERAQAVVIDITGIAKMDYSVADWLIQTAQTLRLLGSGVIVSGVATEVARALVSVSTDVSSLRFVTDLEAALNEARAIVGR